MQGASSRPAAWRNHPLLIGFENENGAHPSTLKYCEVCIDAVTNCGDNPHVESRLNLNPFVWVGFMASVPHPDGQINFKGTVHWNRCT